MANQTDNQLQNQEAVKPLESDSSKQLSALKNEMEAKMHPDRVDSRLAQLESKILTDNEKSEDVSKEEELLKACDKNSDGVIKGRKEAECMMDFNINKGEKKLKELDTKDKELDTKDKELEKENERLTNEIKNSVEEIRKKSEVLKNKLKK